MSKMESQVIEAALAQVEIAQDTRNRVRRKRLLIALGATVLTCGLGYGLYSHFYASRFVSTDNAYTAAETAQVTPAISGIVREVRVADTQQVREGDVVVTLDDTDAKLALAQAEAELSRSVRRVRGSVANDDSLAAQIASRASEEKRAAAQVAAATADFERAQVDLTRREALASSGSVSGDELTKARNAFATARGSSIGLPLSAVRNTRKTVSSSREE